MMGLFDSVLGSVTGGKTSPLAKALLLLLAAKAASSYFGKKDEAPAEEAGGAAPKPPSGKIESGILAGLPNLDSILDRFRSHGHEDKVQSWIGAGENKPLAPHELERTLGPGTLDDLQKQTGMSRDELLKQLSTALPQVVDKLTPEGRLPKPAERAHW